MLQTCKAVERLVAIWEERRVFGASGAKPFKEIVASAPSPRKSHAPGARAWFRVSGFGV